MKKLWILLFAGILLLSACGDEGAAAGQPVYGDNAPKATVATTLSPAAEGTLLGVVAGDTCCIPRLGLTCTLPEAFVYSTTEELLAKNGLEAGATVETLDAMAANRQPVHVMYALDQPGHRNIMVTFQQAEAELLAEKDLKADLQAQLGEDIRAYETMGLTGVTGEYTRLTVDGKALDALVLTGENQGRELVSVTVQYKSADGLVTLTLNGNNRQTLEQLLTGITLS